MKRIIWIAAFAALAACGGKKTDANKDKHGSGAMAGSSTMAGSGGTAMAGSSTMAGSSAMAGSNAMAGSGGMAMGGSGSAEVPATTDFEDTASKGITDQNLDAKVTEMEKELGSGT